MITLRFNPVLLRVRRQELKMTQKEVAIKSRLSIQGYQFIELGRKEPKSNTIAKIAISLNERIDYFFSS